MYALITKASARDSVSASVFQGTHRELLELDGYYKELWDKQQEFMDDGDDCCDDSSASRDKKSSS